MPHGGKRPGAGRPLGSRSEKTLEQEALRQYIFDEVVKNKESIVASLIQGANAGNVQAIKEVFDRAVGKVTEDVDLKVRSRLPFEEDLSPEQKEKLDRILQGKTSEPDSGAPTS